MGRIRLPCWGIAAPARRDLCGGALAAVIALLLGGVVLRLKGPYFAVFTFGMAELMRHTVLWWEITVSGTIGRLLRPVPNDVMYFSLLGLTAATVWLSVVLARSRIGLALASIGEDEGKAETLGINVTYYKVMAFVLSAALMGLVGAVIAPRWTYVDPHIAFNPLISFQVIIMALLGGPTALPGQCWARWCWPWCRRCSSSSSATCISSSWAVC